MNRSTSSPSKLISLLYNPRSGRGEHGSGEKTAQLIRSTLEGDGHRVQNLIASPELTLEVSRKTFESCDAIVIAGGDGTVNRSLEALINIPTPIYHFPLGTENLFSREFGTSRRLETLRKALQEPNTARMDLARANGRLFAIMASVGFDACVVERVAAARTGGVTKADYVREVMKEILAPRVPTVTIRIDGKAFVTGQPGLVVVANSRHYAARLNPAKNAQIHDGLLDVVFMPHASRIKLLALMTHCLAGTHIALAGVQHTLGREVIIETDQPCPLQLDGEAGGLLPVDPGTKLATLRVNIVPSALNVLSALQSRSVPQPVPA